MQAYFMPTLKENAVVMAIQTAVKALQDAFDTVGVWRVYSLCVRSCTPDWSKQ